MEQNLNASRSKQRDYQKEINKLRKKLGLREIDSSEFGEGSSGVSDTDSDAELNYKDLIDKLQSKLLDVTSALEERQTFIRQLEARLYDEGEANARLRQTVSQLEGDSQQLKKELEMAQNQADLADKEKGRLECKLQNSAMDARNEQDFYSNEMKSRDETINKLRRANVEAEERLEEYKNEILNLNRKCDQLEQQLSKLNSNLLSANHRISSLEGDLEAERDDLSQQEEENSKLDSERNNLKIELARLKREMESIAKSDCEKDENVKRMSDDFRQLSDCNRELANKMEQRDYLLQKLSSETSRLKERYEEKLCEIQMLTDSNQTLHMDIMHHKAELERWRKYASDDTSKKNATIKSLQEELLKSQNQYRTCNNELQRIQSELSASSERNKSIENTMAQLQKELHSIRGIEDQLEVELEASKEKLSTCQAELILRDQNILELKKELAHVKQVHVEEKADTKSQEKYLEDLYKKNDELNLIKKQQNDELITLSEEIAAKDLRIMELEGDNQHLSQEIRLLHAGVQEAQSNTNNVKLSHQMEVDKLYKEIEELNGTIMDLRSDCEQYESQSRIYKSTINSLKEEIDKLEDQLAKCRSDFSEFKAKVQENADESFQNQTLINQLQNENAEYITEIDCLKQQIKRFETCEEVLQTKIKNLQESSNMLTKQLGESRRRQEEVNDALMKTRQDRETVGRQFEERKKQLTQCEHVISELSSELTEVQSELTDTLDKYNSSEEQVIRLNNQIKSLSVQLMHAQEAHREVNDDFLHYKFDHETHNQEVTEMQQSNAKYKQKLSKLEESHDKLKSEFEILTDECNELKQKNRLEIDGKTKAEQANKQTKEQLITFQKKMKKYELRVKQLDDDVKASHQKKIDELKVLISEKDSTIETLQNQITDLEKSVASMKMNFDTCCAKLSDKERNFVMLQDDLEQHIQKGDHMDSVLQSTEEELQRQLSRASQLETVLRRSETECKALQSRCANLEEEVSNLHDARDRFQRELDRERTDSRQANHYVSSSKQEIHRLQIEVDAYTDKNRQLLNQVDELHRSVNQLESDLQRSERRNKELTKQSDQNKRCITELQDENEELEKKLKALELRLDEKDQVFRRADSRMSDSLLGHRYRASPYVSTMSRDDLQTELLATRKKLEEAEQQCQKLRSENALVTSNLGSWVDEQKLTNERLNEKVQEQNAIILSLQREKGRASGDTALSREDLAESRSTTPVTMDKIKALQSHSAQQQALLNQMRNKLEDMEQEHQRILKEKNVAMEDYTNRLKEQMDQLSRVQEQLRNAEKEIRRLKAEVEHADLSAQSYRVQAESRAQTINSLKYQLEAQAHERLYPDSSTQSDQLRREEIDNYREIIDEALKETGATHENSLQKSYWIRKVSELSQQLQQNSEYWSEQLGQLSQSVEQMQQRATLSSPTMSAHYRGSPSQPYQRRRSTERPS